MKKVINSFVLNIPPGNYFIEDIEDIYEMLASVCTKVIIETERYEFESLQELKEYKGKIEKLTLIANDPYVSVEIGGWVKIYTNKETPLTRGVVENIGTLTKDRIKRFNTRSRTPDNFLTAIIALFPITGVLSLGFIGNKVIGIGLIVFGVLLWLWAYYVSMLRKSTIRLVHKNEAPNFLRANLDKIIIAIISAIAGGIVKFLIDALSK